VLVTTWYADGERMHGIKGVSFHLHAPQQFAGILVKTRTQCSTFIARAAVMFDKFDVLGVGIIWTDAGTQKITHQDSKAAIDEKDGSGTKRQDSAAARLMLCAYYTASDLGCVPAADSGRDAWKSRRFRARAEKFVGTAGLGCKEHSVHFLQTGRPKTLHDRILRDGQTNGQDEERKGLPATQLGPLRDRHR
jgi:hypothetical protein